MSWLELFPITARINAAQHLELGGADVCDLAAQFGTPLYIYDTATIRAQAELALRAFRTRWSDVTVLYATKAYFAPFLARLYRDLGLGLDVTSEAEIVIAQRAEFDSSIIYLHGNNKTPAEIRAALAAGITHFVVDHLDEIAVLQSLAPPYGIRPQILIRLAPNIDPHTHRYLTTGVADSKFGLRIQDGTAEAAARAILDADAFDLVGLHFHIGSQVFDIAALGAALETVLDAAADWHARFGFNFRELDIGGGWGVAYDETQTSLDIEAFAAHTTRTLRAGLHARGLNEHLKLLVEPGRGLIARAGVALYRIGVRKEIPGVRRYVAVDGGIGDNLRPALYGAHYQAYLANRMADAAVYDYTIAGRYCEQGDVLIESTPLPEPCIGDLVAIPVAGAYQLPMASNYNLIPRPAVVRVGDGAAQLVRRRETLQDLLAADVEV